MGMRLGRVWSALRRRAPAGTYLNLWKAPSAVPLFRHRLRDALVLLIAGDVGYILNQSIDGGIKLGEDGPDRNCVLYNKFRVPEGEALIQGPVPEKGIRWV